MDVHPKVPDSRHHIVIVADIEGFGRRSNSVQYRLRRRLYAVMSAALEAAWVVPQYVPKPEDRGDGILWVLPGNLSKGALTGRFTRGLAERVGEGGEDPMRLRVSLHAGEVVLDEHGWVGTSVNDAFRLVNAQAVRDALAEAPAMCCVFVFSRQWHEALSGFEVEGFDWSDCRRVSIDEKEFHEDAWVCLEGGTSVSAGDVQLLVERAKELEDVVRRVRERYDHVAERVVQVSAFPAAPAELRSYLVRLGEPSRLSWAADEVEACGEAIDRFRERVERTGSLLDAALAERDELRGRLEAYKTKEGAHGLPEDRRLAALYDEAHERLWRAPCDLPAARRATERYEAALRAALGYGTP